MITRTTRITRTMRITRTLRIRGKFWVFCHSKGGGKQLSIFHHSLQFCHGEKKSLHRFWPCSGRWHVTVPFLQVLHWGWRRCLIRSHWNGQIMHINNTWCAAIFGLVGLFFFFNFSSEAQELRGVPTKNSSLQEFPKGISEAQRLLHLKGNAFRGSLGRV